MAELIERLMGLAPNGTDPSPDESVDNVHCKITLHFFTSAQSEIIRGALTVQQVKNFFHMNTEQQAEYDALIALAPTGTTTAQLVAKLFYILQVEGVLIIAEKRPPGYSTPAEVRTKLGL